MSAHYFIFFFSFAVKMMRNTSLGLGFRFSETNRTITSAGALNIVTRLASRTVTGHELPIQVHQHYGLDFHLVLDKDNGSNETCISRGKRDYVNTKLISKQLERSALHGLCSCIYDNRRVLSLSDKVEQCLRAKPLDELYLLNDPPHTEDEFEVTRWMNITHQGWTKSQQEVCCCRPDEHYVFKD
jgi:hypothetical protein